MIKFYFSKNRTLQRVPSCGFSENAQNSFLRLILNFPKLEYNWILIKFYAVVLEYAFTSRTVWKENENETGYVHTIEHKIWAITVGYLTATVEPQLMWTGSEERKNKADWVDDWELCFRNESAVDLLVYRPSCDTAHALLICILKTLQQISLWMLEEIQRERYT